MAKTNKDYSKTNPRASFYSILYESLRLIAVENGYTLAIHGSMARDMDLVAIAWKERVIHPDVLIHKFVEEIGATIYQSSYPKKEEKPHGRLAYGLYFLAGDWYLDISVIPPRELDYDYNEDFKEGPEKS